MRVLVTGAAGFIGSHVLAALQARGHDATAWVRPGGSTARLDHLREAPRIIEGDLSDAARIDEVVGESRPEAVVHLAWYAVPGRYWTATENLDCLGQGLALLRSLADHGCSRLVMAGTCAEYDWAVERHREDETPCRPRTLYGAAKLSLQILARQFCAQSSLPLAWLRYYHIFGPGEAEERLVPSAIRAFSAGEDLPCTHGRQVRDFTYVEDLADATVSVMEGSAEGPINIGSGRPTVLRDLLERLAEAVGGGRPLFGAREAPPDEPGTLLPDLRRLFEEVGWRPSHTLDDGIDRTLSAWRRSHKT